MIKSHAADFNPHRTARVAAFAAFGCLALTVILLAVTIVVVKNPAMLVIVVLLTLAQILFSLWLKYLAMDAMIIRLDKTMATGRRYHNIVKYYESVLQDSTDIIFTIDHDGLILKFNRGAQMHFDYSQADIVGKPFKILFVNEADNQKILDAVLQHGKSANEEIAMKTKEGEIIHTNMSISEMKDEKGHIIGMVVTAKDITEKKKLELELVKKNEMLERLAITDSMTDLYNSRHFYDQIKRELLRYKRNAGRSLSLILLDVDHFKEFNDTEGHQRGDGLLKALAHIMKNSVRKDIDSVFRYGGDEFVVLLPDTDAKQALVVADRIQKQFNALQLGKTSLSLGIAQATGEDDDASLVKRADELMYVSKKGGRGRITVNG